MSKREASEAEWSKIEIVELVKAIKALGKSDWNAIVDRVKANFEGFSKTARQCREKYLDIQESKAGEVRKGEVFFLILLHKVHSNNWEKIMNLLGKKDASVCRQYFNDYLNQVTDWVEKEHIPDTALKSPTIFLEVDYLLELLIKKSSRATEREGEESDEPHYSNNLVGKAKKYQDYQDILTRKFIAPYNDEELPLEVVVDLSNVRIKLEEKKIILAAQKRINSERLKNIAIICFNIHNSPTETPSNEIHSATTLSFPIYRSMLPFYVPKKPLSCANLSLPNLFDLSHSVQPPIPIPEPLFNHTPTPQISALNPFNASFPSFSFSRSDTINLTGNSQARAFSAMANLEQFKDSNKKKE